MVDDFTGWNENAGKLESCMEAAASDCLFAFGSQDKLTLERNESTFSNCTNTELKSLAVVASLMMIQVWYILYYLVVIVLLLLFGNVVIRKLAS